MKKENDITELKRTICKIIIDCNDAGILWKVFSFIHEWLK